MIAVGSPRATSLAKDGPLNAPRRGENPSWRTTCAITSVMRSSVVPPALWSRLRTTCPAVARDASFEQTPAVVRRHHADDDLRARQGFLEIAGGRRHFPERVDPAGRLVDPRCLAMDSRTSGSYAHRRTRCSLGAQNIDRAVPHAPAPMTAISLILVSNEIYFQFRQTAG